MDIVLVLSFLCFLIAALSIPTGRVSIGWLGLALYVAATLFVGRLR